MRAVPIDVPVVIVGGGPVGMSMSLLLSQRGVRHVGARWFAAPPDVADSLARACLVVGLAARPWTPATSR